MTRHVIKLRSRKEYREMRKRVTITRLIQEQRKWIDDHGGCLAAYVERYGTAADPAHCYGNGGEAVYKADRDELSRLESLEEES
jgi:hypothetical protein